MLIGQQPFIPVSKTQRLMLSVIIATAVLCIGFISANSVSVFKNNDVEALAKAFIELNISHWPLRIIDESQ